MSSEKNRLGEPLSSKCLHLCVDMQRLFREKTDSHTPWMARVIPTVRKLVQQDPARTVFTRFVPLRRADEGKGTWRAYYERWSSMTIERLGESMIDVIPELAAFIPPACLVDKRVYSPWVETDLERRLEKLGVDTLVISGGETDVCVLATVLGAVDRGYRVLLVEDALCSSKDETHDASIDLYRKRFGQQIEIAQTRTLLQAWPIPLEASDRSNADILQA
jgi:nicotinamidase-related amidase